MLFVGVSVSSEMGNNKYIPDNDDDVDVDDNDDLMKKKMAMMVTTIMISEVTAYLSNPESPPIPTNQLKTKLKNQIKTN